MLSSLILSFAMSTTPTPAINNGDFIVENVGGRRNSVRINMNNTDVTEAGGRRNSVRINMDNTDVTEAGGRVTLFESIWIIMT
jgi:hypothetical protein